MGGFIWRKYVCALPVSGEIKVGTASYKSYPHLMRWELLEDAFCGVVYLQKDGPPSAICYDLQAAMALFHKSILGGTNSRVVDIMSSVESFNLMILNAYAGGDTPFFWSKSDSWDTEMYHLVQLIS